MTPVSLIFILLASWNATYEFNEPVYGLQDFPVITGTVNLNEPGKPMYPVKTLFIPLPEGAQPVLEFTASSQLLARSQLIPRAGIIEGTGLEAREVPVPAVDYSVNTVELEGVFHLAGTQVAVVNIYPLTEEGFTSSVSLSLSWRDVSGSVRIPDNHLLTGVVEGDVYWPTSSNRASSFFWGKPWAKIAIEETGAYEVSCAELEESGCSISGVPVQSVSMFSGPGTQFADDQATEHSLEAVSIQVEDVNSDGIFNENDKIKFIAGALNRFSYSEGVLEWLFHRYSTERIYWLTWGGAQGARMVSEPSAPGSYPDWGNSVNHVTHLEDGGFWMPRYELRTGWFWKKINSGEETSVSITGLLAASGEAEITLAFAVTESDRYSISLNGGEPVELTGAGTRELIFKDVNISQANQLEVSFDSENSFADFYLDYVEVSYPALAEASDRRLFFPGETGMYNFSFSGGNEVYDVTDLMNPQILTGVEYSGSNANFSCELQDSTSFIVLSSNSWQSPVSISPASPGRLVGTITTGDRLFVVPDVFLDDAYGMESLMETMGFATVVATTTEIYDEFGQGVKDPGAIRSAVRWAMDSWATPVGAVILGGDANYDPLGYATTLPDLVPAMIFLVNSSSYPSWAEDDWFVRVHEGSTFPEIPISRIPAGDASSFGAVSAKSSLYYSGEGNGNWSNKFVLFADDEWGQSTSSATERVHTDDMEEICYDYLPFYVKPDKFYLIEYPWPSGTVPGGVHPDKPDARIAFRELWNGGMGAMLYFGHGSANQIAHEKVMLGEDPASLTNGARLPLAMFLSCDVSRFFVPGVDCISEKLVYHPAGGAIATIGATGGTTSSQNFSYASRMVPLLTSDNNSIGHAFWAGKLLAQRGGNTAYYVLMGLPDLVLPMSNSDLSVELIGDTLRAGELNTITGSGHSSEGLALIEITESDIPASYTMLSGGVINYFHQGGTAWRGRAAISESVFSIDCMLPYASYEGPLARVDCSAIVPGTIEIGADAPLELVRGDSPVDFQGPELEMWMSGQHGIDEPTVTGESLLKAELSDPSGITFLGGSSSSIQLFIDNEEFNLSEFFTYNTGSTETGVLEYTVADLAVGRHLFILQALDGAGNLSRDSMYVNSTSESEVAIDQHLVYPNPGNGRRCFSFTISTDAFVTISLFTTSGRLIAKFSQLCSQGYNQMLWNGLDGDGDIPASGSYIYVIEAETEGGVFNQSSSVTGVFGTIN